jgi:flagellar assembly factor FliW
MPKTQTKYFGEMTYTSDAVVWFPEGLLGFEDKTRFLLLEEPVSSPLCFLQSIDDSSLCFPVMPATQVDAEFRLGLDPQNCRLLSLPIQDEPYPPGTLLCLAIVNFGETAHQAAANLLGPVVIHVAAGKAAQVVQFESDYQLKHPVPGLDKVLTC